MMELSYGKHESKQESIISLFLLVSVILELYWTYLKSKLSCIVQPSSGTGVIHDDVNTRNAREVSFNTAYLS